MISARINSLRFRIRQPLTPVGNSDVLALNDGGRSTLRSPCQVQVAFVKNVAGAGNQYVWKLVATQIGNVSLS